jgi:hypothetical protein
MRPAHSLILILECQRAGTCSLGLLRLHAPFQNSDARGVLLAGKFVGPVCTFLRFAQPGNQHRPGWRQNPAKLYLAMLALPVQQPKTPGHVELQFNLKWFVLRRVRRMGAAGQLRRDAFGSRFFRVACAEGFASQACNRNQSCPELPTHRSPPNHKLSVGIEPHRDRDGKEACSWIADQPAGDLRLEFPP